MEILRRWVNLQVFGSVTEGVTHFGADLASGHVLLKLIQAVASNAIEVEEIREEVPLY